MNQDKYLEIKSACESAGAKLIAVSKTKPVEDLQALYDLGHRDFGENKVQEMEDKKDHLPHNLHWHMIGHLQRNKVKYIAPYVYLIHGVDSLRLLKEINKQAKKVERRIPVLLQMHIAEESSKFGLDRDELEEVLSYLESENPSGVNISGMMGMATFTENRDQIKREFTGLAVLFEEMKSEPRLTNHSFGTLSMGMSGDYKIALDCGSNMVRVGSLIFGARN
jgi:hypothetical protein